MLCNEYNNRILNNRRWRMFCRNCGKEISSDLEKCPICNNEQVGKKEPYKIPKKNIWLCVLLGVVVGIIFCINSFASTPKSVSIVNLSQDFKSSLVLVREGVDDFRGKTVEDVFLNKTFISNELPNGIFATARYGKISLKDYTYVIRIEFIEDDTVTAYIDFKLIHYGDTTLYESAEVYNYETGAREFSSEFLEKVQVFNIFNSICENKLF